MGMIGSRVSSSKRPKKSCALSVLKSIAKQYVSQHPDGKKINICHALICIPRREREREAKATESLCTGTAEHLKLCKGA